MGVDKPRSDYQAGRIYGLFPGNRLLGYLGNPTISDSDIRDVVESCLRIHDASIVDDDIEILSLSIRHW